MGAELIYDDKAKAIEKLRYGFFWRLSPTTLLGLNYNRLGDKVKYESTISNQVNYNTTVGTTLEYIIDYKRFHTKTAVEHKINEDTTLKGKVNNYGDWDASLTAKISPSLKATLQTGGNASNWFNGKTSDNSYIGLNLNFEL